MKELVGDGACDDEDDDLRGEGVMDALLDERAWIPSAEGNDEGGVLVEGRGEEGFE